MSSPKTLGCCDQRFTYLAELLATKTLLKKKYNVFNKKIYARKNKKQISMQAEKTEKIVVDTFDRVEKHMSKTKSSLGS